jgi:hypothetical protein
MICAHNHECVFGEIEEEMMRLSLEGDTKVFTECGIR